MLITVNNNKVNYTTPANVSDGINFLNSTFKKVASFHYTAKTAFSNEFHYSATADISDRLVFSHIYGTFTKDITKKILYYAIHCNLYSKSFGGTHNNIAVSCNPNNSVDYFDVVFIQHAPVNAMLEVWIKTFNTIKTFGNYDTVVDYYQDIYVLWHYLTLPIFGITYIIAP